MGWNTVVIVMNDATSTIAEDPTFGASLASAMRQMSKGKRVDVPARGERMVHVNAATVVSHSHADVHQIIVAHANTGYHITHDPNDGVPEHIITMLEATLKIRKKSAKHKTLP